MEQIRKELSHSTSDPVIKLLLSTSNIDIHIKNDNRAALRDIAGVVGGDPFDDTTIFRRRVEQWLTRLREAIDKIVLSVGFQSSGSITDALNHPGFISVHDGLTDGLIFEQIVNYTDGTGVLSGPLKVVNDAYNALVAVSGSKTEEAISADNFYTPSTFGGEMGRAAQIPMSTVVSKYEIEAFQPSYSLDVAPTKYSEGIWRSTLSDTDGRSVYTGPRMVFHDCNTSDARDVEILGGMSKFETVCSEVGLATARFALVGEQDGKAGATTQVDDGGFVFNLARNESSILHAHLNDTMLSELFSVPSKLSDEKYTQFNQNAAGPDGAFQDWVGGSGQYNVLGMDKNKTVLIPLSGLGDVDSSNIYGAEVLGLGSKGNNLAPWVLPLAEGGRAIGLYTGRTTGQDPNGLQQMIDVKGLCEIASHTLGKTHGLIVVLFDIVVVTKIDRTAWDEARPGVIEQKKQLVAVSNGSDIAESIIQFNYAIEEDKHLPYSTIGNVVNEREVTPSVVALRRHWNDSKMIHAMIHADEKRIRNAQTPVGLTAFRNLLGSMFEKDSSIISSRFKDTTDGGARKLLDKTVTPGAIISGDIDTFLRPFAASTWIGPDRGCPELVVLSETKKGAVYDRWVRLMDYILFSSSLDIQKSRMS
jgi:hypothetical protein